MESGWVRAGKAALALAHDESPASELDAARDDTTADGIEGDYEDGVNIAYIQYLRQAIPRQFLPQVGYSEIDPALLYLIEHLSAQAENQ
jgi:hypothetical protein